MYIYNITSKVAPNASEQWLTWLREIHIPEVLTTGMFTHHRILRLLEVDESEGVTWAVQYFCSSLDAYKNYIEHFAPALRKKTMDAWGDQVISFRTIMQVVE